MRAGSEPGPHLLKAAEAQAEPVASDVPAAAVQMGRVTKAEDKRELGRADVDRSEGFGERLLGVLLDRAHEMPPQLIAPLIAEEVGTIGGYDVSILLQDYEQLVLVPLPGRGLTAGEPELIDDSPAGAAFLRAKTVEVPQDNGVRMYLPLLDGSDQVGAMALTLDTVDDDNRRMLRRLAGLVADMIVTKETYTDQFFRARRRAPMGVAAEIQWSLLPPLTMSCPQAEVAGILEPAYDVAGDSFDYALNDDVLHMAMIDALGHGLDAATMATVAIGAYRHARRADIGLAEIYAFMDQAIKNQFGPDHFVTVQMMRLDITTGQLQWVNAGPVTAVDPRPPGGAAVAQPDHPAGRLRRRRPPDQ
ncbi:Stage II sporulation protein E (SpoIIE) [Streptomyces sp. PpalLS-921]|nr:Stage II sporulation protein E (SpoIIE) [Streptomyces sp. PpalLS-921]